MIFLAPVPFREALDAHDVKSLLPTTGRTRDLQQLSSSIKRRSLFSATVQSATALQKLGDGASAILAGQADQATVRLGIKQLWQQLGYQPDPEHADGILDLGSSARIDLQIETNVATARGAGWYEQGQQSDVLDQYPAQELYDTAPSGDGKGRRDWVQRWIDCGGKFSPGNRMIAPKNDPIWNELGNPEKFPDGLGNPYPPYAFSSKWRVRDIDRAEAIDLGLIDRDTELLPQPLAQEEKLQASPDVRDAELRREIEQAGLGRFDANGIFKPGGGA